MSQSCLLIGLFILLINHNISSFSRLFCQTKYSLSIFLSIIFHFFSSVYLIIFESLSKNKYFHI
ncbi:hypothetical protein HOG21_03135 [bacterium]|nr:hypothetical protein [bacterium]